MSGALIINETVVAIDWSAPASDGDKIQKSCQECHIPVIVSRELGFGRLFPPVLSVFGR